MRLGYCLCVNEADVCNIYGNIQLNSSFMSDTILSAFFQNRKSTPISLIYTFYNIRRVRVTKEININLNKLHFTSQIVVQCPHIFVFCFFIVPFQFVLSSCTVLWQFLFLSILFFVSKFNILLCSRFLYIKFSS